jgi:hypothetical protein
MNTKICTKCKIEKPIEEFYKCNRTISGIRSECILCGKEYTKLNRESIKIHNSNYYRINAEKIKRHVHDYTSTNLTRIINQHKSYREINKEKVSEYQRLYYQKHKAARVKQNTKRNSHRRLVDSSYDIICKLRHRINLAIKNNIKSSHTLELLGCSLEFFKSHLQQTAINNGYIEFKINNFSGREYHIDHIIPCSAFNFKCFYHQKLCFHYSNMQILRAKDNGSKGNKILMAA